MAKAICRAFLCSKGKIVELVKQQAEDDGLWFEAKTAPEAYLQQELRKLHTVIEGIGPDDFEGAARGALTAIRLPTYNMHAEGVLAWGIAGIDADYNVHDMDLVFGAMVNEILGVRRRFV